jgi:hypothetical protein
MGGCEGVRFVFRFLLPVTSTFCPPLPRHLRRRSTNVVRRLIIQSNSVALSPLLPLPSLTIMRSLAVLFLVATLAVAQNVCQLFRPHPTF